MKTKNYILAKMTALVFLFLGTFAFAQAPDAMSYQAVVRDATGTLMSNKAIGVKMSVLKTSASGTVVYAETFTPKPVTNSNGLMTLEIGKGTPLTGTYSAIDWSAGPYFVKSEIDPAGGTTYSVVSTSQLLSVPYALYAKNSGNGFTLPYTGTDAGTATEKFKIVNLSATQSNAGYFVNSNITNAETALVGINNAIDREGTGVYGQAEASTDNSVLPVGVFGRVMGEGTAGAGVYGQAKNAYAVYGATQNGTAGYFLSNINGKALETVGKLHLRNIGEGAGKVLTSDAVGYATWQTPSTQTATPKVHFSSTGGSSQIVPTAVLTTVNSWLGLDQSGGANYNAATGEYTVPVTGYYAVKAQVSFSSSNTTAGTQAAVRILVDGSLAKQSYSNNAIVGQYHSDASVNLEKTFTAGQKIKIAVLQFGIINNNLFPPGTNFSIHLIH